MTFTPDLTESDWGPLSEPLHTAIPESGLPFRDNAFLCFWDREAQVCGVFHASTSPNAEGRRARLSLDLGGDVVEIVEDLEPGTFTSNSLSFDLQNRVTVQHPRVTGELQFRPRFALADYNVTRVLESFGVVREQPPTHFQRAAAVTGWLTVDGRRQPIRGDGFRDRSWGLRDESANLAEYVGYMWVFSDFAITVARMLGTDGGDHTLGYRLGKHGAQRIEAITVTRDASGLFVGTRITFADNGGHLDVRTSDRVAGFWVPMGWERTGPTMSAYDEFGTLHTSESHRGFGMVEQGILRRIA
jgi:hypothetical protein